jgi:hypothetical protein
MERKSTGLFLMQRQILFSSPMSREATSPVRWLFDFHHGNMQELGGFVGNTNL